MTGILDKVKTALGITGGGQDATLQGYIDEVIKFIVGAGVPSELANSEISVGVIARGVSDLWNYGEGKLSPYFYQRVSQLVYTLASGKYIVFAEGDYGTTYKVNVDDGISEVIFVCGDFVKNCPVNENCVSITFTKEEAEHFKTGTYNWKLKIQKENSVSTILSDGTLIVSQ